MDEIQRCLPHRPPFLFVERIVRGDDKSIVTEKTLRAGEPYFAGHFPGRPIMPGVLICEFVFQSGAILMARLSGEAPPGRLPVITRIQNVKLRHPARPGDTLCAEVTLKEKTGPAFYLEGRVRIGEKTILSVEFAAMLVDGLPP